jgi:hypothetical protein
MPDVEVNITENLPASVEVVESGGSTVTVELPPTAQVVEVAIPGPQGPQGPPGEPGSDAYYEHTVNNPTTSESINHGLSKFPAVTAQNSAGDEVDAGVNHIDEDNVLVTFSFPFSGKIYFS